MIARSDGGFTGGAFKLTDEMVSGGAQTAWAAYLKTGDVDATVQAILADGGALLMPAVDLTVGRIAMVTDPQGAAIYVMTPAEDDMENHAFNPEKSQYVRWNELMSSDPDASIAFYARHFGITQEGDMDTGEMGKYRFIQHNGVTIGAVMGLPPAMPVSAWAYIIGVDDIDRAIAAVNDGGGQVVNGPMEIPGGEFALYGADPQGAAFGLVGPRKA